ncbi:hypothetical protein BISA_1253 [Bifidobacterium saguini DSM 23967]|uniref:DUF4190 domain-containing protein n=3 Tax=Bifidobacterium TaxID=1678 RepID=A0A2N5IUC1_9BIFI|nr:MULTISPECIES: DUF4190 domain-containing protein [Bifidobacterium]KFI93088.1 hypothetical protein BISA_1253 [Bifidobacterium saguini DSM 23967]PLS25551.1 hypothetical protein Tam1G_0375 [Bifidobacterium imperatoris]QSY57115.1 hypothetical protein BLI708_07630 [Bifidobacterium imperatoris]QTB91289.1 hypothetical protein BSD967_02270 [Bifidobacterium saguini]
MSQPEQQTPEYGQYKQPEYGAMAGQYGPNYNPYLYGAPEPDSKQNTAEQQAATANAASSNAQQQNMPGYYPGRYPGAQGQPYGQAGQQHQAGKPYQPHYYNGIDLNDPNQNPLYGHWDSYAIISFVLALFFPVPVLSALMGIVAMWRTRTFHMKGFGLAVAAVVLNVLYTLAVIWMALNGYDAMSLYQEALQQLTGGAGSSSGDSISA